MTIQVGDVLRVVAVMIWLDGNVVQNVFNAVIGGSSGPYDEQDITDDAEDWCDQVYAELDGSMSEDLTGSEIRVYVYDAIDDDWDEIGSNTWVLSPSVISDELPRGVAALINAKTTDPDVNGKKYFGGLTESSVENGLWNANELARLVLAAVEWTTAFTGAVSTAPWVPGIWSPTRTTFYAMSGTEIIPTIPAYQRRRKQGVGI